MDLPRRGWLAALSFAILAACGGGGGGSDGGKSSPQSGPPPTQAEAARFLTQASFGPTTSSIGAVVGSGYSGWLNAQFTKPQHLHQAYVDQIAAGLATGVSLSQNQFFESFWQQATSGDDALRQRVAFALSEIFVVSFDGDLGSQIRGVASYYDMLGRDAFGNFRTLLEDVAKHPMMGIYLSHMRNQKEDGKGRVPDENFAREVMQLFTIGLYTLNPDGTQQLVDGKPVETYTNDDVSGLAKVLTGWSWAGPDKTDARFWGSSTGAFVDRDVTPMQAYPKFHSISEKRFLGLTLPAQSTADADADLKAALDQLFNHPNVGPFFGRQLIQRLVMSNPSPAYVQRVAAAFADNGQGVRGDMRTVLRAVLLDAEARDASAAAGDTAGKLREPIVRLANWLRAFNAGSASGRFLIGNTDSAGSSLGQSPMRSSSVFNFFRPGYTPPGTSFAALSLVAPELQITNETSVAGYLNLMKDVIERGIGTATNNVRDVQPDYSAEIALADTPDKLVDRVNLLLVAGNLAADTRQTIIDAVTAVTIPTDATKADTARKNRVRLAIFLTMASSDYLAQK
jgi:uncharacterized protein (DUF1800 family)